MRYKMQKREDKISIDRKSLIQHYIRFLVNIRHELTAVNPRDIDQLIAYLREYRKKIGIKREWNDALTISKEILEHFKMMRGIALTKKLKDNLELHNELQSLSKPPRDHVIHPLFVFFIGCVLLDHYKEFWVERVKERVKQMIQTKWKNFPPHLQSKILDIYFKECPAYAKIYACWGVTALFHDIGCLVDGVRLLLKDYFFIKEDKGLNLIISEVVSFYDSFFSEILGTEVRLNEILEADAKLNKEDHGYLSAPYLVSADLTLPDYVSLSLDLSDFGGDTAWDSSTEEKSRDVEIALDHFLYYECLFSIIFHKKGYINFLSPMLQLLVLSDNFQEADRYLHARVDILSSKLSEAYVFCDRDLETMKIFAEFIFKDGESGEEDARSFFNTIYGNFDFEKIPDTPLKEICKAAHKYISKMGMQGLEVRLVIKPPEKDKYCLLLHKDCGRMTKRDIEHGPISYIKLPCGYCKLYGTSA
jgi:hypothetical protein